MKVRLIADGRYDSGGTSLICHNPRLLDDLDEFKLAIAALTGKRKKTLTDHQEIAQLEFLGGLYTNPVIQPDIRQNGSRPKASRNGAKPVVVIPGGNVHKCLSDGATRIRRGKDVGRGVKLPPDSQFAPLQFEGPANDPLALYRDGRFTLRKDVGVGQKRIIRTRPVFDDWQLTVDVEVDPEIWNLADLAQAWDLAGRYCGIGDRRPLHGLFKATIEELS